MAKSLKSMVRPAKCGASQERRTTSHLPLARLPSSVMPVETEINEKTYTPVRAPRGSALSCKGWQQEAAMRMLMNNLDEEVGERPRDLVVYGGTGKAAC